ncbi:PQQ-dependent sugar dehydrogenase [Marilutibacter spongiae]|uniref:PQQ-dependent sugar dehydrogenase n=1 Tax=Marilutibacter spongiae TaxID=2025720 RepID=A0A7W3TN20_9GAMM|nr:PQQ-dependent sugar dehydrogenase [Lysobacter spongiae]MBB1061206.1 PQQ-dependent sugar dehydrogenase [Lysobacter spongiae]
MTVRPLCLACIAVLLVACGSRNGDVTAATTAPPPAEAASGPFASHEVARFDEPWAMSFLPDGRLLVTEKKGHLKLLALEALPDGTHAAGAVGEITGLPEVDYGGQGGLGDVIVHPKFKNNGLVYLSYAEPGDGDTRGAAVARARLVLDNQGGGRLEGLKVIWRQVPKVTGQGHYSHRLAFGPDGHLWISSGERQKFDPAQDMASNLGKILRLNDDGSVPADNPFPDQGEVAAQVWSLGHRNVLGIAFDADGQLWNHEMGPKGGDELNRVERGGNYGYPIVSNGDHYDGRPIPDHDTQPQYNAPVITWTPVISPSSLVIYSGDAFPDWTGNALITGLSSESLVRVAFDGEGGAREAERFDMGHRMREIEQGPQGHLWLLEDGDGARLLELVAPPAPVAPAEP